MSAPRHILAIIIAGALTLAAPAPSRAEMPFSAAETGNIAALRAALDAGEDINATNVFGDTALTLAARSGQLATLQFLLNRGAQLRLDTTPNPLTAALDARRTDIARYLVTRIKNDPQHPAPAPRDPLSLAITSDDEAAVDKFLADPRYQTFDTITAAIALARQHGRLSIEQRLLSAFAPIAQRHAAYVKTGDDLNNALTFKRYKDAEGMLIRGADPNYINDFGSSVLHTAVSTGDADLVALLLRYHADPLPASPKIKKPIPLFDAAEAGNLAIVQLLLTGRETRRQLNQALYLAVGGPHANADLVRLLLKHKADPNLARDDDDSVLKHAQRTNNADIIQALRQAGAKP